MSLVPANPLMSEPRTTGEGPDIVTLFTGQDAIRATMEEFCTNDKQKALWAKPSVDVEAYAGRVDAAKVKTRPSYLNGVLIQSRGHTGMTCFACSRTPGRGPFTDCRRVQGHFDGACGNCKWRDHAARCTVRCLGEESEDEQAAIEGLYEAEEEMEEEEIEEEEEEEE